jgi:hypothetical protein
MSNPQETIPKVRALPAGGKAGGTHAAYKRALLSQTTMAFSLAALTLAMAGGAKEAVDLFREGLSAIRTDTLGASLVVLGVAYLFGWTLALASTRAYGNLLMPPILRIYTWGTLAGVAALYVRIILKLFQQPQNVARLPVYLAMLVAGMVALLGLHLIGEECDLRPYSVPLLLISLFHLAMIVTRYVFLPGARPGFLFWDLAFFCGMLAIAGGMLAHLGIFGGLRRAVDGLFRDLAAGETD